MRTPDKVVVGTRGSRLALAQTELIVSQLRKLHPGTTFEARTIRTSGDKRPTETLLSREAIGFFTKELEESLLAGEIDLAVHSLKDLPILIPDGLEIAAVTLRENPQDVLVTKEGRTLAALPPGSRIGTGSPRRRAQLLNFNASFNVVPIRGNIETRIGKIASEGCDAIVLAGCGLARCGIGEKRQPIPFQVMLPAPGQGALAVEIRRGDEAIRTVVSRLDHPDSRHATAAERAFHASLGGGCQLPLGALGTIRGRTLILEGVLLDPDGKRKIRLSGDGPKENPEAIGEALGQRLKREGAEELLHADG